MAARRRNLSLATGLIILNVGLSEAEPVTLNFDSVALAPGSCTDASAYLASFGISFVSISGGASPAICNEVGSAVTPSSSPNVFFGLPAVTNTDESYDLLFSTPLSELSFTRATVASNTALPPWSAFAFDASNNVLSSIVQPLMFPGPVAANFVLFGPDIVRLRVAAFNSAHVTFNHPPFDDLTLTPVPEPSSLVLLGTGLAALIRRRRSAKRRRMAR